MSNSQHSNDDMLILETKEDGYMDNEFEKYLTPTNEQRGILKQSPRNSHDYVSINHDHREKHGA